jgi:nucleotide-binding universal stress UspA family protein
MDAILKEYQQRGKEQLKEIQELAQSKRIECKTVLRVGNFVDECLRFIKEKKPMVVILTRAKRSELSRLLFGSAVNEIKKKSPVPIRIVKE